MRLWRVGFLLFALVATPHHAMSRGNAAIVDTDISTRINDAVEGEMVHKQIPAIAVALVNRDGPVWTGTWELSDDHGVRTVSSTTRFRIGTASSLFTAIAVLQQVEAGRLDLDAPVQQYLPGFRPRSNCDGQPISLRHLLTHSSGLVREAPVGSYWDQSHPSVEQIVASLNSTDLTFCPGTETKFSNAGIAVVAMALEVASGQPYEAYLLHNLFEPLAMDQTTFDGDHNGNLTSAVLQSLDWERLPTTVSGTANVPARGIVTSIRDISRFAQALLGEMPGVRPETLTRAIACNKPRCNGSSVLGFAVTERRGQTRTGLRGSTYGYGAELQLYPAENLAVVALGSSHEVPTTARLGDYMADLAFDHAQSGEFARTRPMAGPTGAPGYYRSASGDLAIIRLIEGRLWLESPDLNGELRRHAGHWAVDDTNNFNTGVELQAKALRLGKVDYRRLPVSPEPPAPPPEMSALIGDYGWDHDYFRIYERDGKLYARSNWVKHDRLRRRAAGLWEFSERRSDFWAERLQFDFAPAGLASALRLNGLVFPRRHFGEEANQRLKALFNANPDAVAPNRRASPPASLLVARRATDLVPLDKLAGNIHLDVRYATTANFLGVPVYDRAAAYLQLPAASALRRVAARLERQGYGLVIHDAYRPWSVTKIFWDATPTEGKAFVADPAQGSRHNRGSAVDLSLYDLKSGKTVEMPGLYDEMSSRSYSNFIGGTSRERWLRDMLRDAMQAERFAVLLNEWWHFDHVDWADYPVGNQSFGELEAMARQ